MKNERSDNKGKAAGRKILLLPAMAVVLALPLVSCSETIMFRTVTTGIVAATEGVFMRPDVNLKQKSHAAADFLVQKFGKDVTYNSLIEAKPLHEVDNTAITSPLGTKIPEDIGLRLIDLGYNVSIRDVATGANDGYYNQGPIAAAGPDFVLTGSYIRNRKDIDVFLRVVNAKSGQVVAAFDYKMYLTSEVRKLSETQTRIYRINDR